MKAQSNSDTVQATGRDAERSPTNAKRDAKHMHWDELEDWRKDNAYIVTGYARPNGSWLKSWAGLLGSPHNETVNILTHLLGGIIAITVFIYSYRHVHIDWFGLHPVRDSFASKLFLVYPLPGNGTSVTWADSIAFASFYISAAICFGCSATFHTSLSHSETVSKAFNKLDYVGIVFLICGTYYPALFYAFYCQQAHQAIYMAGVTAFGATTVFFILSPDYSTPDYRRTRTLLFIGLGLSGVIPVVECLLRYGWAYSREAFGLDWLLVGGGLYIVGALLYAERIPERFAPGKFDLLGASHQIFHVACLLAALAHYVALCHAFTFRHHTGAGLCQPDYQNLWHRWIGEV